MYIEALKQDRVSIKYNLKLRLKGKNRKRKRVNYYSLRYKKKINKSIL